MKKIPVSVVIITKNEEERIADCIRSVIGWADEVIMVDDESTDKTCEIAENLGAKVLKRKMEIEGRHRNWACQQAKNDWILSLDADERPTEELKDEITQVISNPDCDSYSIPRRNYIGDKWLRWGGQYPSAQVKLFRKDEFSWKEERVHPVPAVEISRRQLENDIIHYSYRNWADYLKRTNGQTTLEARKWLEVYKKDPKKARYKMNLLHALWRTLDRFFRMFIRKRGYRDGFYGFMVAYLSSAYQIMSYAKFRELRSGSRTRIKPED
jgi:glycosyltransferase involved in cell wall biosynthesis